MQESEILSLLEREGFSRPKSLRFSLDDLLTGIDFFPVALKIESSHVVHKSDVGGVALHIQSYRQLEEAKNNMVSSLASHGVTLEEEAHFLVTQMVEGIELFLGLIDDPIFGKVIFFGAGGIFLELYKDRCFIDVDATQEEIIRSIETTTISKIFHGFRSFSYDLSTCVELIQKFQRFVKNTPTIVELDLNPLILSHEGIFMVDARAKTGDAHHFPQPRTTREPFFTHHRVAIIGAGANPAKVGYAIAKNSLSSRCPVYFVNAKGGELFGKPLYPSVETIEGDIDTVVITTPAATIFPLIPSLVKKGLKNLIIISAGFKEVGDNEGEERLKALADEHNISVIGPNCLGYYSGEYRLNLTFGTSHVKEGHLALISQSGAVLSALMDKASRANIGFSHLVSVGNMVDIDFAELITMLDDDPLCHTIAIYAEGVQKGKHFLEALRKVRKPVILFKTGKSAIAQKAAFSHTGNLSGDYDMFKGLIQSVGGVIEESIESLIFHPHKEIKNVIVLTNAGGPASILSDGIVAKSKELYTLTPQEIEDLDGVLPFNWPKANPVDIIGDAMSDRYEKALRVIETFEGVDAVYMIVTPQYMTDIKQIALLLTQEWKKPILPIFLGDEMVQEAVEICKKHDILFFQTLQEATAVLG